MYAAKPTPDKPVMNKSDRAAKNDAKKYAHINDLETKNIKPSAAVKLRVTAPAARRWVKV